MGALDMSMPAILFNNNYSIFDYYEDLLKSLSDNYSDDELSNETEIFVLNLNTSMIPFPNEIWHVKPLNEVLLKFLIMLITAMAGILFNLMIIITILKNKWLSSSSDLLVLNMASLDFVTLLVCPSLMLIKDMYQNYVLEGFGCRFEGFIQASLLLSSVGAACLVCYDRLAAAVLDAEARIARNITPLLIVGSWIIAIGLSLPWIFKRYLQERQWYDFYEAFCVEEEFLTTYWYVILPLLVWLPLGVMSITYGIILWKLKKCEERLKKTGSAQFLTQARKKAIIVAASVLGVTIVCRVPYTVLGFWRASLPAGINTADNYLRFWFAANYLMYLNSALNPIIYGFTIGKISKALDESKFAVIFICFAWICCKLRGKNNKEHKPPNSMVVIGDEIPEKNLQLTFADRLKHMLTRNQRVCRFGKCHSAPSRRPKDIHEV